VNQWTIEKTRFVLTVNEQNDFNSLKLRLADFEVFEFHNFWKKWTGDYSEKESRKVYQPISLKRLYYNYFRKTIHGGEHSATEDALATVKKPTSRV
jgi:hypothetical protein